MKSYKKVEPLVSLYEMPPVFPEPNTHPRILVTPSGLDYVRDNLKHPDHALAYEMFIKSAQTPFDYPEVFQFSPMQLESIANKALAYLLLGDVELGKESVKAILHVLRSHHITYAHGLQYAYGLVMHTAARVYDWAFDLTTPEIREEIVSRCEYELGPNFEVEFPPTMQGMVTGHGSEEQMFRDWLSLGIAAYDEYPDIYNFVAGRIWEQAVPPRNYYFKSGAHWQGSAYGAGRFGCDLFCNLIFYRMTGGTFHIFTEDMEKAAISFLCNIRADGEPFRDGDDYADRGKRYSLESYQNTAFLASVLYRNPILRDYAMSFDVLPDTPSVVLLTDDPSVGRVSYRDNIPRVRYMGSPRGQYVAHTKNGASVYFKVGESYSANHEWKDSGTFMIYYKGSLASASNCYEYTPASDKNAVIGYASELDFKYNKMTVSSNCMLVFDPLEDVEERWGNSGGQRAHALVNQENELFSDWMAKGTMNWAKILAHGDKTDREGYLKYCMIMGDHTNAYSDKIKDYRRTSLAVAGDGITKQMLVFVFDRLETRDPSAKKTWQMHTMGEYAVDGSRAVSKHKDGGMLVCDTLLPKSAELGVIGNFEERFIVNGVNLAERCDPERQPIREDGRGRLTVSPKDPSGVEFFLHAIYVTDCGMSTDSKAELIEGEGYVASRIDGIIALFPKSKESITEFTVDLADGSELYATNLAPGKWTDVHYGFIVDSEEKMIVFKGCGKKTFRRLFE